MEPSRLAVKAVRIDWAATLESLVAQGVDGEWNVLARYDSYATTRVRASDLRRRFGPEWQFCTRADKKGGSISARRVAAA